MKAPSVYGPDDRKFMDALVHAVWHAEQALVLRQRCICGRPTPHEPATDCWMKAWGWDLPPVEEDDQ